MPTISYIINAINNASRVFTDVADSATKLDVALQNTTRTTNDLNMALGAVQGGASRATSSLNDLRSAAKDAADALASVTRNAAAAGAAALAAGGGGGFGGFFGALGRAIPLFGGLLNTVLPAALTSVKVWHAVSDAILEVAAVLVPVSVALGAFSLAASDAVVNIQRHFTDLHTVMDATGKAIPPLTGALEAMHRAAQPQVYQVLGDALDLLNKHTGAFATLAKNTGVVVDQLAARIVVAANNSQSFFTQIAKGPAYLQTLGDIFANIGRILGDFIRNLPGYADIILHFVDDLTGVVATLAQWAQPIIAAGLLLHGFFLYLGLAVTGTLALIGALSKLAMAFFTFAAAQVTTGIAAIKAFGSLLVTIGLNIASFIEEIVVAQGAAAKFGVVLNTIAGVNPWVWAIAGVAALAGLVFWATQAKDATQQLVDSLQKAVENASLTNVVTTALQGQTTIIKDLVPAQQALTEANKNLSTAYQGGFEAVRAYGFVASQAKQKVDELTAGQQQLQGDINLYNSRLERLGKTYGGVTAAQGLLVAAGVTTQQMLDKNGEAWAIIQQQVDGVSKGYMAMGQQAGTLGNDLQVLDKFATDQYQAMQKLNQAWDTFIQNAAATQSAFDTYALGLTSLSQANQNAGISLATAEAAVATAQDRLNRLQNSGSATSLQLTAAQDRLTAAQGRLQQIQQAGTPTMDGLNKSSLQLNQAFAQQVTQTNALFDTWRTAGIASNLFTAGVKAAIVPMLGYAKGSQEATAQLVALAQEAGYQGPVSLKELEKWLGNVHNATKTVKDVTDQATIQESLLTSAMNAQGNYIANTLLGDINNAILKYDGVTTAATNYGKAIAQYGQQSTQAKTAQDALINSIVKAGQQTHSTTGEIAAMITKLTGIPTNIAIKIAEEGLGHYTIQQIALASQGPGGSGNPQGGGLAAGGYLNGPGTKTSDSMLIRASTGEYIVQAAAVDRYGVGMMHAINTMQFALGGLIPGFQSGGSVGGWPKEGDLNVLSGQAAVNYNRIFIQQFTTAMEKAIDKASIIGIGGLGVGGSVQSYAPIVAAVLQALGQSVAAGLPVVLRQMQTESGGNMFAVNLSDSNARAGYPSTGLMQVIRGTYATYGAPYFGYPPPVANGVSENPTANIFAGVNYAIHRYPGYWMSVLGQGHGYDSGGWLMPGWTMAYNGTGSPEMVTPPDAQGGGQGFGGPNMSRTESLLAAILQAIHSTAGGSDDTHGYAISNALNDLAGTTGRSGMTSTRGVAQW